MCTLICVNICHRAKFTAIQVVQRGVLYSGCKIFNNLPLYIKSQVGNSNHFMEMTKNFLLEQATYSLDEYFKLSSK